MYTAIFNNHSEKMHDFVPGSYFVPKKVLILKQ